MAATMTEAPEQVRKRLALIEARKRGVQAPIRPPNPYAASFIAFLRDCCWTIDKAMAGKARPWPRGIEHGISWDDYWADLDAALLGCAAPLLIDKTRRTMISNVLCAFELWLAAGGHDPRWPVLEESQANRLIIIQAQKMGKNKSDEGCAAEFVAREEAMYHLMVEQGLRQRWPGFPQFTWGFGWGTASNGSKIVAVGEGPDQIRGPGPTWLRMEELAAWEQAQATCAVAMPALYPYGRACAVTTASAGTYAHRIRNGEISTGRTVTPEPPKTRVLPLTIKGDWHHLEIRGEKHIPGYEPGKVGAGMPSQDFRREVLGDWSASSGKLVFEEYGDVHEPNTALPFDPARVLLCGWDLPAATGGTPAFACAQLSPRGQLLVYGSLLPGVEESLGPLSFAMRVGDWLMATFCAPLGLQLCDLKLEHYADPAGDQVPIRGGVSNARLELRSAYDEIRDGEQIELPDGTIIERPGMGWQMQPGEVTARGRFAAMRQRLSTLIGGAPAIVLSPKATYLREGFRGGYHYAQRTDGQYELDPAKNRHSHPQEALQYLVSRCHLHVADPDPRAAYLEQMRRSQPTGRVAGVRGR